jgi:hypothetical protein
MSSTPIDQVVHEQRETFEVTLKRAIEDGVVTKEERISIAVTFADLTHGINGMCGTVSATRTALHAGIDSPWTQRKIHEHSRDMAGQR